MWAKGRTSAILEFGSYNWRGEHYTSSLPAASGWENVLVDVEIQRISQGLDFVDVVE